MDEDRLMPEKNGRVGRIPKLYEVEKGQKTESYIVAVTGNPLPPLCKPDVDLDDDEDDEVDGVKPSTSVEVHPLNGGEKKPLQKPSSLNQTELEPYKQDPFWVRLRWILLILLVIFVLAMIIASVVVILLSPSCDSLYKPFNWKNSIISQVWTPSFQDSDDDGLGDLAGVQNRLDKLQKIGVTAVWLYPFLDSDSFTDAIVDFKNVDPKLGSNKVVDSLVTTAHSKGLSVLISFPISTTSDQHNWFIRSSKASNPQNANFSAFYHWRRINSSSLNPSIYSQYNNTDISYMHYANNPKLPVLNWQNDTVREHMFECLSFWIDKGIDGFHLSNIEYLARTSDGSEPNWSSISDIIRDIRDYVDTYSRESTIAKDKQIVLFAYRNDADETEKEDLVKSGLDSVVNYELGTISASSQICGGRSKIAGCTHEILSDVLVFHNENPAIIPMWQFGNPELPRLANRVRSRKQSELLTMIQLMLPGANSFYYGEEIGMRGLINDTLTPPQQGAMQWDDSKNAGFSKADNLKVNVHRDYKNINYDRQMREKNSQLKMFQTLAVLRSTDQTLMQGMIFVGRILENGFTVSRFSYNDTGTFGSLYIAAVNFGSSSVELQLADIPTLATRDQKNAEVITQTSNAVETKHLSTPVDISSGTLLLQPESGVVLKL